MINKILNNIYNYKQKYIIVAILFFAAIWMTLYSFSDVSVWWDEAIYIGMGKYIVTGGRLGMWELFRPPLLPLFYAAVYLIHLPLIFLGKVLVIISGLGSLFLSYVLGNSIKKGSGIYASLFLLITPVFFYYTKVPTTDIISVFFVMLSLYFYTRNKFILTGFVASIAFLLRFPQGLVLIPIAIIGGWDNFDQNFLFWFKKLFHRGVLITIGFIILVLPYFILNYFLYGGFLKPLILADEIVTWSNGSYNFGIFYYAKEIFQTAPFLYLAIFIPFAYFKIDFFENQQSRKNLRLIILTATIIIIYFVWQLHKEFRYSLAFIPYLAILSGISFHLLINFLNKNKTLYILLVLLIIFWGYLAFPYLKNEQIQSYKPLNEYLKTLNGTYLSTTPIPSVFGSVRVSSLFESASTFHDAFSGRSASLRGVILKDCDIYCPEKREGILCNKGIAMIKKEIKDASYLENYQTIINQCTFSVYYK